MKNTCWLLLIFLIGCSDESQQETETGLPPATPDVAEIVPPQRSNDPTVVSQYFGVWETDCFFESTYFPAPDFLPTSIYKNIRLEFTEINVLRIEQRFDDDICTQFTGDNEGLNFFSSETLSNYRIPGTVIDAENTVAVGVIESEILQARVDNGRIIELSSPSTLGRLIYRNGDELLAGEFAFQLGRDVFPLDWANPYMYLGEAISDGQLATQGE